VERPENKALVGGHVADASGYKSLVGPADEAIMAGHRQTNGRRRLDLEPRRADVEGDAQPVPKSGPGEA
jgi:hypothetical protein